MYTVKNFCSIKNNKKSPYWRICKLVDTENKCQGIIFRLDAKTLRRNNHGENSWDVFYIVYKDDTIINIEKTETEDETGFCFGKYQGEFIRYKFTYGKKVNTPLGIEIQEQILRVEKMYFNEIYHDKEVYNTLYYGGGYIRGQVNSYDQPRWAKGNGILLFDEFNIFLVNLPHRDFDEDTEGNSSCIETTSFPS